MNLLLFTSALVGVAWPLWTWMSNTLSLAPRVDLGYEIHEALSYNATTDRFTFRNIRYAQAPVGDLRYAPPVAPTGINPVVQKGNESRICPQPSTNTTSDTTEDCLFLDVVVPRKIFDKRETCRANVTLHYIMADDKPGALIDKESHYQEGFDGLVYVSANYRLGRLGQLAPELTKKLGSECADLGSLDRDLALQWVHNNIHLFGGNGKRVFTIKSSWS